MALYDAKIVKLCKFNTGQLDQKRFAFALYAARNSFRDRDNNELSIDYPTADLASRPTMLSETRGGVAPSESPLELSLSGLEDFLVNEADQDS